MRSLSYPSSAFNQLARRNQISAKISHSVKNILTQVEKEGDAAIIKLTKKFDKISLKPGSLKVPLSQSKNIKVSNDLKRAARQTYRSVTDFAHASIPHDWSKKNLHGAMVGEKFNPIERVGIYIPGGSVPLVSSVFMTVALAKCAGVPQIVVCSPPPIADPLLWAFTECGATEIYQIGGAQAIGAMAYGTKTINAVDKIFGPGNAYVTEAKRQVFGRVGIDLLAGPSELMIIADPSTRADWAASDLLAQAEHGSGYERVFCVSSSKSVLQKIAKEVETQAHRFKENPGLTHVLNENIWFIHCGENRQAEAANALAPEHLQIMTHSPQKLAKKIHTAGAIFFGNFSPTVLGDFVAGPSHTLPTGGAGRSFSGLRVHDFLRRTSLVEYSPESIKMAKQAVAAFSTVEELPAHGFSLQARFHATQKSCFCHSSHASDEDGN